MDEQSESEWRWFARAVRDALLRPRAFAAEQAREHYGLAGILVAIGAGFLLSISIDSLVVGATGLNPVNVAGRIVSDAALVGIRVAVLAAVAATAIHLMGRLDRRGGVALERAFTAIAFGLAPLTVAPFLALVLLVVPELLPLVGLLAALVALRLAAGLALNLGHLLRPTFAVAGCGILALVATFALSDQISRIRFVALGYAPDLAPALAAAPAQGTAFAGDGFRLTLPAGWRNTPSGLPGEAGHFETDTASLIVLRVHGDAFRTLDGYADAAGTPWVRGTEVRTATRVIERVRGLLLVDDTTIGAVDGRPVVLRQFTAAIGTTGMALQLRYIAPPDAGAALAEAAAIAASWEITGR